MSRRTLVFSDIVGSTQLLELVGDSRWTATLELVDRHVEEIASAQSGRLVKSLGDGHLVVFQESSDALRYAIALQRAMEQQSVSELPITVRIGVHAGDVVERGDDLSGRTVHAAARISALATSGQTLCSLAVREAVGDGGFQFGSPRTVALRGLDGLFDIVELDWVAGRPVGTERAHRTGLLDRGRESRWIDSLLERALSGRGAAGLLEAPAGMGKTSLMRFAAERAQAVGLTVVQARGDELEMDYPFGLAAQLLDECARDDAELLAGEGRFAAAILGVGDALPGDGDGLRERRALLAVLLRLAERHPIVALVDDAHWSDVPSLQWVAQALRRTDGQSLTVIVAARPAQSGEIGELLDRIRTQPGVERLEPRPLSADGVRALVQQRSAEVSDAFVEACLAATGGNPFLVHELLRSLDSEGAEIGSAESADDVARSDRVGIDRVVLARLAPLGLAARSLAAAAAIFPTGSPLRHAARLADLDIRDAGDAADSLTAAGILESGRPLRFVHPLTRQAIYDELTPTRRSELHRRALTVLAADSAPSQDLAAHALLVEPDADPVVVDALVAAARSAQSIGAPDIAARYLERALVEPPHAELRPGLQNELGELYLNLGRYAEGVVVLGEALDSQHNVDRVRTVARITECYGYGLHQWERAARIVADELARVSEPWTDDHLRLLSMAEGFWTFAPDVLAEPDLEEAAAHISGRGEGAADVLSDIASRHMDALDASADEVRALVLRALELAIDPDDVDLHSLIYSENIELVVPHLEDRLRRAAVQGSRFRTAVLSRSLGDAVWMTGDLPAAEAHYAKALELTEGRNVVAMLWYASVRLERGRIEEVCQDLAGRGLLGDVDAARGALENQAWFGILWFLRSRLALVDGDLELAETEQRRADAEFTFVPWTRHSRLCDILLRQGRRAEALEYTEITLGYAQVLQAPSQLGLAMAMRARCLADADEALQELALAVPLLGAGVDRYSEAEGLIIQGETLRRAQRTTEARVVLARARELAEACDAQLLVQRAVAEQKLAGAKPRRTALTGVEALTASERRVAELAAAGRSNLEIAGELVLSVRTVEMHLGRAYRKLGVTGRRALAGALAAK